MIKIKIITSKIGSRWYTAEIFDDDHWLSRNQLGNIEATRHDGSSWTDYKTTWTLTGLGCKKYRNEVIEELNKKYDGDNKLKDFNEQWKEKYNVLV